MRAADARDDVDTLRETGKRATIMLVDDEPTTIEVIETFLQGEGYSKFVKTSDSRKALDLFARTQPDVLLLDLMMPNVGGLEILGALRGEEASEHIPVIILTSSTDPKTKLQALELGATDFLSKPVDSSELGLRLRNTLAAKAHRDHLVYYRAQLERKVEERTAEIDQMRVAAERASQAKSQFLANMSHEIRTPMTAICGYTDLLIEDPRANEDQRQSLAIIKRNSDHLLALINGILDLSKIEAGHMQLQPAPVDLVELLLEVVRAMQVRADERGLQLAVEIPSAVPTSIVSDAVRIRQAVINLVENAVKFTQRGSVTVRLDYDASSSLARVQVIDTGIGVAPERIPSMFLQFEQADPSSSRQFGGTGLGLAITRRLARLLGGDCAMESEVGAGSTVTLTLRAPLAEGAEIRSVPEEAKRLREERRRDPQPLERLRARILLVEDGLDNQRLISMLLRRAGAEVEIADNGLLAVDQLRSDDCFDLVLMDIAMPEMDGYTATRTLREMGFEMPIVALTAHALDGEREKCLAAGCDDYLTKPIDQAALMRTLRRALEKRTKVPHAEPKAAPSQAGARSSELLGSDVDSQTSTATDNEAPLAADKSATIMLVDDEPTTIEVIEMFLRGEGYSRFASTSDSTKALYLFAKSRPDVVLLDLVMPDVGGLEILAGIRRHESLGHTPVLILTSSTDADTKLRALEFGASDFLSKPVDSSELALRLRNTLAAKSYQDRLAYSDALTGLPNRRRFLESLERALRRARQESMACTVLRINLDRFEQINETLGHCAGDDLLKGVADRLQKCVREPLSRMGGTEFSLLLPRVGSVESATRVARRILDQLTEPFCVDGRDLFVTGSIGIALFPNDGEDVETLLKHANVALSHAKRAGETPYQFYRASLNAESAERLSLENDLRGALSCDELILYYQPKVDLGSGRIIGAEALMRWKHPELGLLLPDRFIPIAEETDLIRTLDHWAMKEACRQTKEWLTRGHCGLRMTTNVCTREFGTDHLIEGIRSALEESGLDGEYLSIELTESQLMAHPEKTCSTLAELKQMGVKISVDDFGTGYSSLSHLKRLPLDELKIDRTFIAGVPGSPEDAAIVSAIIGLAHSLGLTVVAEGVETEEQLAFVTERGCDVYQGFLFSRPVPARDWTPLLERDSETK